MRCYCVWVDKGNILLRIIGTKSANHPNLLEGFLHIQQKNPHFFTRYPYIISCLSLSFSYSFVYL